MTLFLDVWELRDYRMNFLFTVLVCDDSVVI